MSEASGDVQSVLVDEAEIQAYGKVTKIAKGEGVVVHVVMYLWFTDVSG